VRNGSGHGFSQTIRRRTVAATLPSDELRIVVGDQMALAQLDRRRRHLDRIDLAELARGSGYGPRRPG
jgi:hypothetical protein